MGLNFLKRGYGNSVVMAHLPGQRRIPYLPEDKLATLRDARVRAIVNYAAETVPYYRNLFASLKLDPREIRTTADLDQMPLLDRETVRKRPERFVSTSWRARNALEFVTSGFAGTPLRVWHDRRSLLVKIVFGERERAVTAKLCGRELGYRELYIDWLGCTIRKVWSLYRQMTYVPVQQQRLSLTVNQPFDEIVETINRFQPDVIAGYPSFLETFYRIVATRNIRLHRPRVVGYGGEMMTAPGRQFIEQRFGVPVISIYTAMESFKIGFTCEKGNDFHLHEDLCHVKINDAKGRQQPDGQSGQVVISNLVNHASVLLNYGLADFASLSNVQCICGRMLSLIREAKGFLSFQRHFSSVIRLFFLFAHGKAQQIPRGPGKRAETFRGQQSWQAISLGANPGSFRAM